MTPPVNRAIRLLRLDDTINDLISDRRFLLLDPPQMFAVL